VVRHGGGIRGGLRLYKCRIWRKEGERHAMEVGIGRQ
jgi:hypothetical protein